MIIVNLKGGLGNQMFEYAAGKCLATKHNTELKFDASFLLDRNPALNIVFRDYDLDIFPAIAVPFAATKEVIQRKSYIDYTFKFRILNQINSRPGCFRESTFSYNKKFETLGSEGYLDGYWQSEKYFKPIENIIRKDFAFSPLQLQKNYKLLQEILSSKAVCINIRRGDFVNDKNSSNRHGFVGLAYILNAVKQIQKTVENPMFYIFSDDIDWCKENVQLNLPTFFIDHSHAGKKFADYLQLMTACKHFIIPNSSFAWWAAWLNQNPDKIVIAPKQWFNNGPKDTQDLLPDSWIKL